MNSKAFIQALRKVIREEVQLAVRTELGKIGEMITENRTAKPAAAKYTESYRPTKPQPTVTKRPAVKQFSSNALLNEILNDTEMLSSNDYVEDLNENINYNDYSEWPTMKGGMDRTMAAVPPALFDVNGNRVDTVQLAQTEAGAAVVNALTKDYSAILKAAKAKSKIGR